MSGELMVIDDDLILDSYTALCAEVKMMELMLNAVENLDAQPQGNIFDSIRLESIDEMQ